MILSRRLLGPGLWTAVFLLVPGLLSAETSEGLLLWHFERGIANDLGGSYNVYQREPSRARTYLDQNTHRQSSSYSLRVTVQRESEGFCGVWMDLGGGESSPQRYLDARPYAYLSLWIKGRKGGEEFELMLADDLQDQSEEARPKRPLRAYLPQGARTEWQEVVIPLQDFRGLNLARLARLTLNFTAPGNYGFYLDDIALKTRRDAAPVALRRPSEPSADAPAGRIRQAMWVWYTEPLFDPARPEEAKRLLEFCARQNIGEIYLALELDRPAGEEVPKFAVRDPESYRKFIRQAHEKGMKVEGLAGTPEWAVREHHPFALAAIDAALDFNRVSAPPARLDGIHFDVEPYILIGYADPGIRNRILEEFLEMVAKCQARVSSQPPLRFSCDVPAWFYPAEGLERQELLVEFRGQTKPVGEHLTDMLESVTIMDYVNQADGAGGIIARGLPALAYAASNGRKIVVGLETFAEPDKQVYFVAAIPRAELGSVLAAAGLHNQLNFEGFRLALFSDEVNFHIGLSERNRTGGAAPGDICPALVRLARRLGGSNNPGRSATMENLELARTVLARDPEWKNFEAFELADPETGRNISGFRALRQMPHRTTFYGLGREVFEEESRSAVEWLGRQPSFGGLAIHFYDSYRELLERK